LFKRGFYTFDIEQDLKNDYSEQDLVFLEEIYTKEQIEVFIYGNSFSEGFAKTDANENLFSFNNLFIILS
jgi:hypothetical protein